MRVARERLQSAASERGRVKAPYDFQERGFPGCTVRSMQNHTLYNSPQNGSFYTSRTFIVHTANDLPRMKSQRGRQHTAQLELL